jgi:quercetin dioxygenase-like cupin family protein
MRKVLNGNPQGFDLLMYTGHPVYDDAEISVVGLMGNAKHITMTGTLYLIVLRGYVRIESQDTSVTLAPGMYAALPGLTVCVGVECLAVAVTAKRYTGIFTVGGPAEEHGRLKYIDGCTDTGLIQPLKLGDPCLNYLYFPKNITQTEHTHPSHRVGAVIGGEGVCKTPKRSMPMVQGDMFIIPKNTPHLFKTMNYTMRIVAFHPDSEFGPTDELHQMLQATVIDSRLHLHV